MNDDLPSRRQTKQELEDQFIQFILHKFAEQNPRYKDFSRNPYYDNYLYYCRLFDIMGVNRNNNKFIDMTLNIIEIEGIALGIRGTGSLLPLSELARVNMGVESRSSQQPIEDKDNLLNMIGKVDIQPDQFRSDHEEKYIRERQEAERMARDDLARITAERDALKLRVDNAIPPRGGFKITKKGRPKKIRPDPDIETADLDNEDPTDD